MPDYPAVGDTSQSRDELNTQIRAAGKSRGYLIKQSITSEKRVTWYCSNKYASARCVAGFKAALEDGEWSIIEATEHVEACTRARQRVHANRVNLPDTHISKAVRAVIQAQPPSPTGPARKSSLSVTRPTTRLTRRSSSFSKSITPPNSPPSLIRESTPIKNNSGNSLIVPTKQRRRSSTSSSSNYQHRHDADTASRERSYSAGSWYSYTSEQTATEEGGAKDVTILDPAFHFPTPAQAVFLGIPGEEAQSVTMMRRKRSWSGSRQPGHAYGLP